MDFENVTEETYKYEGLANKIEGAVDYDLIDNSSPDNHIIGKMHKKFVRLDNKYFKRFFEMRNSGEISFSTYFTEEDNKMKYVPQYVSTLIKQTTLSRDCVFETYVPEILNTFKVPTVFNALCSDEKGYSYIASIDFIKPDERLVLFSETGRNVGDFGGEINLQKSVRYVVETIEEIYAQEKFVPKEEDIKEQINDFVKSYLVRVCLLRDYDFTSRNNGFLVNDKEKTIRMAPNFDFELSFRLKNYDSLKQDILFVAENFPDILDEFVKTLEEFTNKKSGVENYKLLYDEVNGTDKYREDVFSIIESQSKQILAEYQNIKCSQLG